MRKRNKMLGFSLNDAELEKLRRKAEKAGMNRSAYIRKMLEEVKLIEQPPMDFAEDIAALDIINSELEAIARRAKEEDCIDEEAYRECIERLNVVLDDVFLQISQEHMPERLKLTT